MERTILAVDIGTSSLKAALVGADGTIQKSVRIRFPSAIRTTKDWLNAYEEAFSSLNCGSKLAAIVVSGNGPTVVSVNSDGDRAGSGPILLWNDPIPHGVQNGSLFIPRISAYKQLFPKQYADAKWILSGPEFLVYALTGTAITILPEPRFEKTYWTTDSLAATGLDSAKLPQFVHPGTIAGKTSKGIPVIAGGPDFIVALVGTNTLSPGKACDRAGTSEGLNVCTAKRIEHDEIRLLPSVMTELWNAAYLLPETGAMFREYRKESKQIHRSYPQIMKEIEQSPVFSQNGEPLHPGRAIVEKIGFSVRRGIEVLKQSTGYSPVFCLSGGQARNEIWNQMKADITGSVFALSTTPDAELMGDAILGFYALGEYRSIAEAAVQMVHIVRYYEPDPQIHKLYSEKYQAQ